MEILTCDECVPAFLGRDLHRLVNYDLCRPVVKAWMAPVADDFLAFEDKTLGCHNRPVPIGHDDLELRHPHWVVVCYKEELQNPILMRQESSALERLTRPLTLLITQ
jgi:hypothetical protein